MKFDSIPRRPIRFWCVSPIIPFVFLSVIIIAIGKITWQHIKEYYTDLVYEIRYRVRSNYQALVEIYCYHILNRKCKQ